jgi:DNA invertase Pin-like site-specific DNA recombinase
LARSARDLLNVLDAIAKAGAGFRSLADAWADTTTPHGRLMLTVLGGLAEFERSLILARTSQGRARAKARGTRFGRKPKLTRHQRAEALERRRRGTGGDRKDFRREPLDDQSASSLIGEPADIPALPHPRKSQITMWMGLSPVYHIILSLQLSGDAIS